MSTHAVIAIDHLGVYIHYDGTRGTVLAYVDEAKARRYYAGDQSYGIARLAGLVCEVLNEDGNGVGVVQVKDADTAESLGVDRLVRVKGSWGVGFTISDLSPSELQDYYIVSDRLANHRKAAYGEHHVP